MKIVVTGCTGYVGNYMIRHLAKAFPNAQIVGISRRGTAREGSDLKDTKKYPNVRFSKGDCLKKEQIQEEISDADVVLHSIG